MKKALDFLKLMSFKAIAGFNHRVGLLIWLTFFIWLKTIFVYFFVFKGLHNVDFSDYFLMLVNPIGFSLAFLALTLFLKPARFFYPAVALLHFLGSLLIYGNVLYFREFSDFLSVSTISGGAGMVGHGFDFSSIPISAFDIFFWIDFIALWGLILLGLFSRFKLLKLDASAPSPSFAFRFFSVALMIFGLTFWGGDWTEHRLVSRQAQYDDTYAVRYLGLGPWLITDGWYTHVANQARAVASKSDFTKVQQYVQANRYLAGNVDMSGVAKNRNLIVLHLESFQQDLIDLKVNGQEVTPFLNSIYHSNSTYSFSNFFNQVGQGKTSDAENMLETSTFGLPTGSLFTQLGTNQTFQAMPAILNQTEGYSSAVFHGNVGSFYNRTNVYRGMGYQNFFDQSFDELASGSPDAADSTGFGFKDKYIFSDSIPYLEQLQQPFYVKYLTVTNHTPYTGLTKEELDPNFPAVNSGSSVVDDYFQTAHYLDQSIKEFYDYLKASGLYDRSIIMLYGDHYGISGSDSKFYAPYLGKSADSWSTYDNTMMQRVPFMLDIPGQTNGHINNEYGGEIDVMPTLEHLLGINTQNYIQFGQDLFASGRQNFVALRNRGFITPSITKPSGSSTVYYDTASGKQITLTSEQLDFANGVQDKVDELLNMSDTLNTEDLLRFYTPAAFTPVKSSDYSYTISATEKRLKDTQNKLKAKSTSLLSENLGKSTASLFHSDSPGLTPPTSSTPASSSAKGE